MKALASTPEEAIKLLALKVMEVNLAIRLAMAHGVPLDVQLVIREGETVPKSIYPNGRPELLVGLIE